MSSNGTEPVSIKPINKTTVHQICSGQVVLNLATAVKELLENSVDAGATSIQIKLEEYGSVSVEVVDDGSGVEEENFQALTLKHHTSKISDFSDLYSVETFGFRGEALSSLCALSDVTITTRHKNAIIGTSLQFDHQGIITTKTKTLRQVGTTVKLENLFCTLPVRRVEFLKNLKRDFSKMCNVLYAYGLQSVGVRLTCTNHVSKQRQNDGIKKGTTTIVMDTKGDSVESNIRSIFGIKQKQNILPIVEKFPMQGTLSEFGLENTKINADQFKLHGYISSCAHDCGRPTSDRQFIYINSRPTDNPKITKLVNEVYHQYNNRQDPFVCLNIKIANGFFDANVTPDKRQILIQNEKILLAILKESLISTFATVPSTMVLQNVGIVKNPTNVEEKVEWTDRINKLKTNFKISITEMPKKEETDICNDNLLKIELQPPHEPKETSVTPELPSSETANSSPHKVNVEETVIFITPQKPTGTSQSRLNFPVVHVDTPRPPHVQKNNADVEISLNAKKSDNVNGHMTIENGRDSKRKPTEDLSKVLCTKTAESDLEHAEMESKRLKLDDGLSESDKSKRTTTTASIDLESLKEMILARANCLPQKETNLELKFRAKIEPQSNASAETELKRVIKKESFTQMEILGQFNLGFIITKLDSDIFIVDQHASDEKYNFETIRSGTVMQTQRMVNPETLELTTDKEELMVQHEQVFRRNGFEFVFDETAKPTRRIQLTSIPLSKSTVFGKDDVDELLFLLEDAPEKTMLRPSRVERMFASRACRKSVMVGTPLNQQQMRQIVLHMGEIEQPWNCPHGRPTMRHLINLQMISLK